MTDPDILTWAEGLVEAATQDATVSDAAALARGKAVMACAYFAPESLTHLIALARALEAGHVYLCDK